MVWNARRKSSSVDWPIAIRNERWQIWCNKSRFVLMWTDGSETWKLSVSLCLIIGQHQHNQHLINTFWTPNQHISEVTSDDLTLNAFSNNLMSH
jgi:hypothetical protein